MIYLRRFLCYNERKKKEEEEEVIEAEIYNLYMFFYERINYIEINC